MWVVLLTIIVFGCIITIHELGHFIAAKLNDVKVNEFALGMGPKLFSIQKGETKYSLRLLPIGGYVAMEGEDDTSKDERAFCNKSVWRRFIIVIAGALMNLILGLIVLIIAFTPESYIPSNTVANFKKDAVSFESGLQIGDEFVKINGTRIFTDNDIVMALLSGESADADIVVKRNGENILLQDVHFQTSKPVVEGGKDQLYIDFSVQGLKNNAGNTLSYSVRRAISLGRMVWISLMDLVTGKVGFDQLSGPVGVGTVIGEAAGLGIQQLLILVAFLTINVGIFNLLPIPALDGGRLIFIIIEAIRKKPINRKYEAYIHAAGIIILFTLMILITGKDIIRLIFPRK